jgi:DNA cross-link repair 1A protein
LRPRPPRQTQITAFLGTPPASIKKSTSTPKTSAKKRAKNGNTSILAFFKPVGSNTSKKDGKSDELFISHGGYGLDVSDPEDNDDEEDDDIEFLWGRDADGEAGDRLAVEVGELELVKEKPEVEMIDAAPPPPADEVEATPVTPAPKPKPKLDLSAVKLNLSSSILFGKPPATTTPVKSVGKSLVTNTPVKDDKPTTGREILDTDCGDHIAPKDPSETINPTISSAGNSDPVEAADPGNSSPVMDAPKAKIETVMAKSPPPINRVLRGLLFSKKAQQREVIDDIEDFTQTQRFLRKRPMEETEDEIQGTFQSTMAEEEEEEEEEQEEEEEGEEEDEEEEDEEEEEVRFEEWEATQTNFNFDPAARAIEGGFDEEDDADGVVVKMEKSTQYYEAGPKCPICAISLSGLSEGVANNHVNQCLDGTPTPLPKSQEPATVSKAPAPTPLQNKNNNRDSAFSKLMSTNMEAHAWASAAKAEASSKGKRATERSCPFYKILFNGPITVDAFRFGKIPGCAAYFLSHFHSDHYIGLSSKWCHGPIYCSRVTANLVRTRLRVDPKWVVELPWEEWVQIPGTNGVRVQGLDANHCPGSMLFLFENGTRRILHCGDFRAEEKHLRHPLLKGQRLDEVYLDTTYLDPKYAFPPQKSVIDACAEMCVAINSGKEIKTAESGGGGLGGFLTQTQVPSTTKPLKDKGRLLIVVGTYSIGKERIAVGIARALKSKIFAPATKLSTLRQLEDPTLSALLTSSSTEAQVHLTPLGSVDPGTLSAYLAQHPSFSHILAFKPSGWSYKSPTPRSKEPRIEDVLYSPAWRSSYDVTQMVPVRGANEKVRCYAVPYSEHSSFRELCCFCCGLNIGKIVPTVNVGSKKSRERMGVWIQRWEGLRKRGGWRLEKDGGDGVW